MSLSGGALGIKATPVHDMEEVEDTQGGGMNGSGHQREGFEREAESFLRGERIRKIDMRSLNNHFRVIEGWKQENKQREVRRDHC